MYIVHLQCTVLHTVHGPHPYFYFSLGPMPPTTAVSKCISTQLMEQILYHHFHNSEPTNLPRCPKLVDFEAFSVCMCFGNPQQVEWCSFNICLDFWQGVIISQFHQPTFKYYLKVGNSNVLHALRALRPCDCNGGMIRKIQKIT